MTSLRPEDLAKIQTLDRSEVSHCRELIMGALTASPYFERIWQAGTDYLDAAARRISDADIYEQAIRALPNGDNIVTLLNQRPSPDKQSGDICG